MRQSIRIGTFGPLCGPLALRTNGTELFAGTQAWLDLFNSADDDHGRHIELIGKDNGYDVERTREVVRELVEADRVAALISANGTPQIVAVQPYLEARGIPVLLPFGGADEWYEPARAGLFGLLAPFTDMARVLGRWAAADGFRRIVILSPDYPPSSVKAAQVATESFLKESARYASVAHVVVPLGSRDGERMCDRIMREAPDAVIVLVNWPELMAVAQSFHRRGSRPALYSWSANVTLQVAREAGILLERMKGLSSLQCGPLEDSAVLQRYRSQMTRLFPSVPIDFPSLHAFGHAMVFTEALRRCEGDLTIDALTRGFYQLDGFETGIFPPITFAPGRHLGVRHLQPMQLRDGAWQSDGALVAFA